MDYKAMSADELTAEINKLEKEIAVEDSNIQTLCKALGIKPTEEEIDEKTKKLEADMAILTDKMEECLKLLNGVDDSAIKENTTPELEEYSNTETKHDEFND